MGNNGSNSRDHHAASVCTLGPTAEGNRGWSQSFPRELTRHRSQPPVVRKVLPEPPVQRLRATDNGSIIHNGGTISGRRMPAFASARESTKREDSSFRGRSDSTPSIVEHRPRRFDRHYPRYRGDSCRPDAPPPSGNLKRCGSEPDLRSSPDPPRTGHPDRPSPAGEEGKPAFSCYRYARESKERLESKYRAKKKYKAPAPPSTSCPDFASGPGGEDSRAESTERPVRHPHPRVEPPPRRSRLFKTRAESKKTQVAWQHLAAEQSSPSPGWNSGAISPEARAGQREDAIGAQDRSRRSIADDRRRRAKPPSGKNTLQRSMSSPEFQAELIQAARRVRDKLDFGDRAAEESRTVVGRTDEAAQKREARGRSGRTNDDVGKRDERSWTSNPGTEGLSREPVDARRRRSLRNKENLDPSSRRERAAPSKPPERKSADVPEKPEARSRCNGVGESTEPGRRSESVEPLVTPPRPAPKTFYFGMNEEANGKSRVEEDQDVEMDREDRANFVDPCEDTDDDNSNVVENISLNIRPTLPKKQLEIPRFSPSAAWRLLSALEAPGPTMSTASEELPLMFEERIERLSRPPPLLPLPLPLPLPPGPRSWQDKSGDSGISGDAGAGNDDSLDVSTVNRMKTMTTRPSWTPQQDLGEESSSDPGVDSPPPLPPPFKYRPPRAHVFSLSLPRDDAKNHFPNQGAKPRETSAFNSLQKLKRSVSGAFGGSTHEHQRKCSRDFLDDNWLLSSSAPTSLQHSQVRSEANPLSPSAWKPYMANEDEELDAADEDEDAALDDDMPDAEEEDEDEVSRLQASRNLKGKTNEFPVIMKPPSFSYLTPAGHVMYLPEANEAEHRAQSFSGRKVVGANDSFRFNDRERDDERYPVNRDEHREVHVEENRQGRRESASKRARENSRSAIDDAGASGRSPGSEEGPEERPNLWDREQLPPLEARGSKSRGKTGSKGKRFTFQSTVRQIERRRIAEKLSKEVEAKERQRKGELEAMRRVEEEFQRKRAKEKASIRQQLRLFKQMEENLKRNAQPDGSGPLRESRSPEVDRNCNSLPNGDWDGSQLSRAEPDGAPSSIASSPTLMPAGNLSTAPSGKHFRKDTVDTDSMDHRGERYRPKYYDWSPDTTSHLDCKQTTVHPKVICDIPKSSPVFLDANVHSGSKPATTSPTPRLDNYRKDFAHGTVAARSCLASSDSELSQANTRPHSRQNSSKGKLQPARSGSPGGMEDAASAEGEDKPSMGPTAGRHLARNSTHDFVVNGVQPFRKQKAYKPIAFNPRPSPAIPS